MRLKTNVNFACPLYDGSAAQEQCAGLQAFCRQTVARASIMTQPLREHMHHNTTHAYWNAMRAFRNLQKVPETLEA